MMNPKWSFMTPPPIPSEDEIYETLHYDAVVVGAGLGGLSAAVHLKELGQNVLLIEKGVTYSGRGGHFGVADSSLMREAGLKNDLNELARQWITMSGNNIDEKLLWLFLRRGGEAMDWLLDKARASGLVPRLVDCRYPSAPYKEYWGAHCFPPEGNIRGNYVSKALYEDAVKQNVDIRFKTPATQLIRDENGRVCGVYAKDEKGVLKILADKGVVLATGDIGGDEEMCRAYAPDALRTHASQYVPVGQNTGDGHKMGLWAGAAMGEEVFPLMMHPQHFAWLSFFFLFVNTEGERFMNEDTYVQGRATAFMRQPEGIAYSILDANWIENLEKSLAYGGGLFWGDPALKHGNVWTPEGPTRYLNSALENGTGVQADTLEELAEKIGIPAEKLAETVARYNESCEIGEDRDFGKRKELLFPIEKGPFIALKMGTVLLQVVGGLAINTRMEVLDTERKPIDGLYAVGDTTGGMYGHEYVTTILGNSHGRALTWGYIAAETIAEN